MPQTRQRKAAGSGGFAGGQSQSGGGASGKDKDTQSVGSSSTTTSDSKKSTNPHHKKIDAAAAAKQLGLNRYFVMNKWHVIVGCICLAVASYCGYVGYLETRVNTSFDDHKVNGRDNEG